MIYASALRSTICIWWCTSFMRRGTAPIIKKTRVWMQLDFV